MIPTPKLRWIHRKIPNVTRRVEMVLQQWFVPEGADKTQAHYQGEWRDVPLETEQ